MRARDLAAWGCVVRQITSRCAELRTGISLLSLFNVLKD